MLAHIPCPVDPVQVDVGQQRGNHAPNRPRTTTRAPPHPGSADDEPARPAAWLATSEGNPEWFPRSLPTGRRVRCPALPLRPRHEYAAVFPRGLLVDAVIRPRSRPPAGGRAP